jgi:hypothetical protein
MWRNVDQLRRSELLQSGRPRTRRRFSSSVSIVASLQDRAASTFMTYRHMRVPSGISPQKQYQMRLRDCGTAGQRGSVRIAGERTDPVRSLLRIGSIPKLRRLSTSFSERIDQRHSEPIWVSGKRCHYLLDAQ